MKSITSFFLGLAIAGLAGCERRVVVEIEGPPAVEQSPEAAAIEADLQIANDAVERMQSEIEALPIADPRRHSALIRLSGVVAEYQRRKPEGAAAAKWYREQLEGQTVDDLAARQLAEKK